MKTNTAAAILILLSASAQSAGAGAASLAWQDPDFIMEEVIATAPQLSTPTTLAWQQSDYVMEEVVATAPRVRPAALRAANRERGSRGALNRTARFARSLIRRAGRRASQFNIEINPLSVTP